MLKYFEKILSSYLWLKLSALGLTIQLVSLFRVYPSEHPCGRVINILNDFNVLINCDSAVYMKDAQQPGRLFNGDSVYQDRPLPTILVSVLAKLWHFLDLPDYYRDVTGNSGVVITYSLITYILFMLLTTIIFSLTFFLGEKTFLLLTQDSNISTNNSNIVSILFLVLISMNEITKTFFWTPGSQMFNLLLPVYLFYLVQFAGKVVPSKFYLINLLFFVAMLFSYAFFIIVAIPLLFIRWRSIKLRLSLVSAAIMLYLLYPIILNQIGGYYNNFAIGYRRMYIWVVDAYFDDTLTAMLSTNLSDFIDTVPFVPMLLLICSTVVLIFSHNNSMHLSNSLKPELFVLLAYTIMISFYGYYARRLTYPLMIFVFLIMLKFFINLNKKEVDLSLRLLIIVGVILSLFSWVFTTGPLV